MVDVQVGLRLSEVLSGRVVAIARHSDRRRVVQVGLGLDKLLGGRSVAVTRHPDQRRVAITFAGVQVGRRLYQGGGTVAVAEQASTDFRLLPPKC